MPKSPKSKSKSTRGRDLARAPPRRGEKKPRKSKGKGSKKPRKTKGSKKPRKKYAKKKTRRGPTSLGPDTNHGEISWNPGRDLSRAPPPNSDRKDGDLAMMMAHGQTLATILALSGQGGGYIGKGSATKTDSKLPKAAGSKAASTQTPKPPGPPKGKARSTQTATANTIPDTTGDAVDGEAKIQGDGDGISEIRPDAPMGSPWHSDDDSDDDSDDEWLEEARAERAESQARDGMEGEDRNVGPTAEEIADEEDQYLDGDAGYDTDNVLSSDDGEEGPLDPGLSSGTVDIDPPDPAAGTYADSKRRDITGDDDYDEALDDYEFHRADHKANFMNPEGRKRTSAEDWDENFATNRHSDRADESRKESRTAGLAARRDQARQDIANQDMSGEDVNVNDLERQAREIHGMEGEDHPVLEEYQAPGGSGKGTFASGRSKGDHVNPEPEMSSSANPEMFSSFEPETGKRVEPDIDPERSEIPQERQREDAYATEFRTREGVSTERSGGEKRKYEGNLLDDLSSNKKGTYDDDDF